jgi:hypothetical protein
LKPPKTPHTPPPSFDRPEHRSSPPPCQIWLQRCCYCCPSVRSTFPWFSIYFSDTFHSLSAPRCCGAGLHRHLPSKLVNAIENVATKAVVAAPSWTPTFDELLPPRPCPRATPEAPSCSLGEPHRRLIAIASTAWVPPRPLTRAPRGGCAHTVLLAWAGRPAVPHWAGLA